MPKKENLYVISYDISSNRMRNKIATELKNYGKRVQYSVFECRLSEEKYYELYGKLLQFCLDEPEDSIRIYYLCDSCRKKIRIIGNVKTTMEEEEVIII